MKCILTLNLIAGFVTTAYNVQIGMGIVAGTLVIMIIALCLRIIGMCPDYNNNNAMWTESPVLTRQAPRPTVIQKQEYILVSNPDTSITIGTRVFAQQPSSTLYPPPY